MLKSRSELNSFRDLLKVALEKQRKKILVCAGTGCIAGGSLKIYDRLVELMAEKGIKCTVELQKDPHDDSIGMKTPPLFLRDYAFLPYFLFSLTSTRK